MAGAVDKVKEEKMVSVTIDGRTISVPEGMLVIEAAELVRKYIPRFCYSERLKPIAACRLCLVEIEGMRGLQASCATPVKEDMVVKTETQDAMDSHKEVLDQVLRYHPLDCPKCERAGCCELEDFTYEFGPHRVSFYEPPGLSGKDYEEAAWSPLITFDTHKCVECFRCIRACDEIHDCGALTADGRGAKLVISTFADGPLNCDFCGSCVSVCPTGAISQHPGRFWKKDWEYDKRESICNNCGHGCTILHCSYADRIGKVEDDFDAGINKGNLCAKGRFGFDIGESDKRLHMPMIRRDGELVEVEWDEALDEAAKLLGADAKVAGLASGHLSIEDLTAFKLLVEGHGGSIHTETRDAEISRYLYSRTGSYTGSGTFDQIIGSQSIAVVDIDHDDFDYVTMIEINKAQKHHDAKITAVGKVCPRIARHAEDKVEASPAAIKKLNDTLFVCSAENVSKEILDTIIDHVASDPGSDLIVLTAQANSRAFGALGYTPLPEKTADHDVWLIAGPVELASVDSGKLIVAQPFRNDLVENADIVFPAALAYEKPGNWVNGEGRVQFSGAAVRAPGLVWPDAAIWSFIGERVGKRIPKSPDELLEAACGDSESFMAIEPFSSVKPASKMAIPTSKLKVYPRHLNALLGHSRWIEIMRTHLDKSREFSPWPFE